MVTLGLNVMVAASAVMVGQLLIIAPPSVVTLVVLVSHQTWLLFFRTATRT